jgi:hypothetical protein
MVMGAEAEMPEKSRNIRNAGKFGARPQAMVKITKKKNGTMVISLRPNCSLAGAKNIGPCSC